MTAPVLAINDLSVDYRTSSGQLQALRRVCIEVPSRSIVGIVGESGCGKSTLVSSIIRLLPHNAAISGGTLDFEGVNLADLDDRGMRKVRGNRICTVFQDPMTTLNPVLSIQRQMIDVQYRTTGSYQDKLARSLKIMEEVGIADPQSRIRQYPHQFSGGMLQRISIAMAVQAQPALLIADEPTTALDATLEVQIIHLLKDLKERIGCSILFISHHLGVIAELCDFIVVMYAGEVVEQGEVRDVFHRPSHPYTRKLLECDPAGIQAKTRDLPVIPGEIPDLVNLPSGCIFSNRCASVMEKCHDNAPPVVALGDLHRAKCHRVAS